LNTVSDKGIAKINAISKLALRRHGDSAVEFSNTAGRLYVLYFIEMIEIGDHRVLYFMLRLADGKRGGPADKDTGRMIVAVISQYVEEHPDDLICFSHPNSGSSNALNRIFHLWARANKDIYDGRCLFFDGAGHNAKNHGLHFMVMHHPGCKDIAELKAFILENSDEFAVAVREQLYLFHQIGMKRYKEDSDRQGI